MQKHLQKILRALFVVPVLLSGSALFSQQLVTINGQDYRVKNGINYRVISVSGSNTGIPKKQGANSSNIKIGPGGGGTTNSLGEDNPECSGISGATSSTPGSYETYTLTCSANTPSSVIWTISGCGTTQTYTGGSSTYIYWDGSCSSYTIEATVPGYLALGFTGVSVSTPVPAITSGTTVICNSGYVTLSTTSAGMITWYDDANTVVGTGSSINIYSAGSYHATATYGTIESGAGNTITLTPSTTPFAPVIRGNGLDGTIYICSSETITLSSVTGGTLTWGGAQGAIPGPTVSVNYYSLGNYYATAWNSCGTSPQSNIITVAIASTPPKPTISMTGMSYDYTTGNNLLCNGATATLSTSGSGILWSTGEQSNSINVSTAGSYYVTGNARCGVSAQSDIVVVTTKNKPEPPTVSSDKSYICLPNGTTTLTASGTGTLSWYNESGTLLGTGIVTVNSPGNYYAEASNICGVSAKTWITITPLTIPTAPSLNNTSPAYLCSGQSFTLSIGYVPSGSAMTWNSGATTQSIPINSVGTYSVYFTNGCGNSSVSSLTVLLDPLPSTPGINSSSSLFCVNSSVSIWSSNGGGNFSLSNGNAILTGSSIKGINEGDVIISCTSTNSCGSTTGYRTITIRPQPSAVISEGNSAGYCPGGGVTLNGVSAGGGYQWYNASNTLVGNTSSIPVSAAGNYYLQVSNGYGCYSDYSAATSVFEKTFAAPVVDGVSSVECGTSTTLSSTYFNGSGYVNYSVYNWKNSSGTTVSNSPAPSLQAGTYYLVAVRDGCSITSANKTVTNQTIAAPTISAPVTLFCNTAVSATISVSNAGLFSSYKWYKDNSPTPISGQSGPILTVTEGGSYTCEGFTGYGCSRMSATPVVINAVTLVKPTITSAAGFCPGKTIILESSLQSAYQWRLGTTLLTIGNTQSVNTEADYTVTVTDGYGCSNTSDLKHITAYSSPTQPVISPAGPVAICIGSTTGFTSSSATGYKWYKDNGPAVIATTQNYSTGNPGDYSVKISDINGCESATSTAVTVTLNPLPVITITGSSGVYINSSIPLSPSYVGGVWSTTDNTILETTPEGTVTGKSPGTGQVRYTYTDANGCTGAQTKNITVYSLLTSPLITPGVTVLATGEVPPEFGSGIPSGGDGTYNYQWQGSPDHLSWNDIPDATGISYQPVSVSACYWLRRKLTSAGVTVYSNEATVTMALNGGQIKASQNYISPGTGIQLQEVSAVSGGTCSPASLTYRWQSSADRLNWQPEASANVSGVNSTRWFRRQVQLGSETVYSNYVRVRVTATVGATNPDAASGPSAGIAAVAAIPAAQAQADPENRNYIRTWEFTKPGITDLSIANAATALTDVHQSTVYFDGLGRPEQTVAKSNTPAGTDLISIDVYDAFGRESNKFLPYTDGTARGTFKTDANSKQPAFYNLRFNGTENYYYSTDVFEQSPLNRIYKSTAPGNSFTGSDVGISRIQRVNNTADSIVIWTIADPAETAIPSANGYYPAGRLSASETMDEHDNTITSYTDLDGRIICKRVQINEAAEGTAYKGWLNTYYVYDDLGQLRFVLQPKAVNLALAASWSVSSDIANELCFRYGYDGRGRMTAKKTPGAGWIYMVYDKRDRLTYTQDANMRTKDQWMVSLYDDQNRPTATGMINYSSGRAALQSVVNTSFDAGQSTVTNIITSSLKDTLLISTRDITKPVYAAVTEITFTGEFQSATADEFETLLGAPSSDTVKVFTTFNPIPSGSTYTGLTLTFYDNYGFTAKSMNIADFSKLDDGTNSYPETMPSAASLLTRGIVTGSRIRVIEHPDSLANGKWLETASFYDDKNRVVQMQTDNYKAGNDITSMRYDFAGKVLTVYQLHVNPAANLTVRSKTNNLYDHAGRLLSVNKTFNDNAANKRQLNENTYDALGMLKHKDLGQKTASDATAMETQDYTYSIRGWLQGINKEYATTSDVSGSDPWFGMTLNYDWGFGNHQYNGNIAGTQWRSKGDAERRAYGFTYDAANRILAANFKQYTESEWNNMAGIDFSSKMGDGEHYQTAYDENGNILGMKQWGRKLNSSALIDELNYTYLTGTNKLRNVIDVQNDTATLMGDFRSSGKYMTSLGTKTNTADDYSYDDNGNLLKDLNKDIGTTGASGIQYNHLNLPYKIMVGNKGSIKYIYDAVGNKLEKKLDTGNVNKLIRTTYIGSAVYRNDTLQFVGHEEGRIRKAADTSTVFDYFVRDHLGNTRMVLTDEQKTDAYPIATIESSRAAVEDSVYRNVSSTRAPKPTGYPDGSSENASLSLLNSTAHKIGPSIILKVMSGDQVNLQYDSYYKLNGAGPGTPVNPPVTDLLATLLQSVSGVLSSKYGSTLADLPTTLTPGVGSMLTQHDNMYTDNSKPKAYVSWILFDEQMKFVSGGLQGVDKENIIEHIYKAGLPVGRNGYFYVYASNESPVDVYFDNLQVAHIRGPLLEETHYYPFGLAMAGISSKAAGKLENRYKYNGGSELQHQEFSDGSGLEVYDTHFRQLDPQLGRWWQIDPKPNQSESPYAAMGNNPILNNDILGDTTIRGGGIIRNLWEGFKDGGKSTGSFLKSLTTKDGWQNLAQGVAAMEGSDPASMSARANMAQGAIDGVKNIPNMSSDELGHAIGFGAEKVVEGALLTKGAGMAKNTLGTTEAALYHYTTESSANGIAKSGLNLSSDGFAYTTPKGSLSPVQAQIELSLSPNRGLPTATFKLDLKGLNKAGITPSMGPRSVTGGNFGAGGGTEVLFNKPIPAQYLIRLK